MNVLSIYYIISHSDVKQVTQCKIDNEETTNKQCTRNRVPEIRIGIAYWSADIMKNNGITSLENNAVTRVTLQQTDKYILYKMV